MALQSNIGRSVDYTEDVLEAMYNRLDDLWARYLTSLNEYITAQATIQKQLSAAFLNLAQANFQSSGRRYGQDYYDQRAVALTRAKVDCQEGRHKIHIIKHSRSGTCPSETFANEIGDSGSREEKKSTDVSTHDQNQLPSPARTPEPADTIVKETPQSPVNIDPSDASHPGNRISDAVQATKATGNPALDPLDPLRWFGILVPPPLRTAQASFTSTVDGRDGVSMAVDATRRLREMEVEIRKLRKAIRRAERDSSDEGLPTRL